MTKTLVMVSALLLAVLSACGWTSRDCVVGETDREVPVYAANETMTFTVRLRGFDGADRSQWKFRWERTGDDGKKVSGEAPADRPFVYQTSLDRPGFVRLCGKLVDGRGVAVAHGDGPMRPVFFDFGAGVDILDIRPGVPEPADFDALWKRHKANLAKVVWKKGAVLKEIASTTAGARLFEFSVPACGGKPVTGYLVVPADASRKYPATANFQGYYESQSYDRVFVPPRRLWTDQLTMFVGAHGFEMGHDAAYYKVACEGIRSNGHGHGFDPVQNADPETSYYAGMSYRVMRAVEYLKSRPEWNGRDLTVAGGSQGGLQAIWAAALVPGVSACNVYIPWNCDIGGTEVGRNRGDWYVKWVPALGYYDPCNAAPRVPKSCRVVITSAGLGDYVCPPTGVMAFYNRLSCPKSIEFFQNMGHGARLQTEPMQRFRIEDAQIVPVSR